jgi:hypothetical protein
MPAIGVHLVLPKNNKMKFFGSVALFLLLHSNVHAQVDTVNTTTHILKTSLLKEGKSSYAVYFEDSLGNRITSADIWDRTIHFSTNADGMSIYNFEWNWYRKDTMIAHVVATGERTTLRPFTHKAEYSRRAPLSFAFANNIVTVSPDARHTAADSAFRVQLDPPAFEFPMDLEIFPLLPFKKTGQQFAIAFYEPGTKKSDYYKLTVTGIDKLLLPGGPQVPCWLLRIDYAPGSYATFWITDQTREVVKMQEYYKGRYRYKVKLY